MQTREILPNTDSGSAGLNTSQTETHYHRRYINDVLNVGYRVIIALGLHIGMYSAFRESSPLEQPQARDHTLANDSSINIMGSSYIYLSLRLPVAHVDIFLRARASIGNCGNKTVSIVRVSSSTLLLVQWVDGCACTRVVLLSCV